MLSSLSRQVNVAVFVIGVLLFAKQGHSQSFSCDANVYRPLCPGVTTSCTCITTGRTSFTQWNFPNSNLCSPDNQILLGQYKVSCAIKELMHNCSSYLSAVYVGNGTNCSMSTLQITGHSSLTDAIIECRDLTSSVQGALIGNATLDIVGLPEKPLVESYTTTTNGIVIRLISPNVTNSATNLSITISNDTQLFTNIRQNFLNITGLYENVKYDIVASSTNCAGTSTTMLDVWTLASPPNITVNRVFSVMGTNDQLEILWSSASENVSAFAVHIEQDGLALDAVDFYCKTKFCFYCLGVNSYTATYLVQVASVNGNGSEGPRSTTLASTYDNIVKATHIQNQDQNLFHCVFMSGSSHYCVVCCSTDPSVPPDSSAYNTSTISGTEVTVNLDGLTSGHTYYCKAAAVNSNSSNCGEPVYGGVKFLTKFTMLDGSTNDNINGNQTSAHKGSLEAWKIIAIAIGLFISIIIFATILLALVVVKRGCHANESSPVDKSDTFVVSYISKVHSNKSNPLLFHFPNPGLLESREQAQDKEQSHSELVPQTVKYTNIHGTFEITVV